MDAARWITIEAERVLYVQHGRDVILCDNHHRGPVTLVVKLTEKAASAYLDEQTGMAKEG